MDASKRIVLLKISLASVFILGIALAKNLWLSARSYPLTPVFKFFSFLPPWIDYVLTPLLIFLLIGAATSPKQKRYLASALVVIVFLFLQDQSRIFPSFYEYSLLLFALVFWNGNGDKENAKAILNACRLIIVCAYLWAGIQKMNPLFVNDFSFFFTPASNILPFLKRIAPIVLAIAPFVEVVIGLGLLIKITRKYALAAALLMHASIFFLIGPFRSHWNDSAWAWSLASGLLVFILFFRADDASAKEILFNKKFLAHKIIFIAVAVLPTLSLVNLWDSPLSFNVYSGNYVHGTIYLSETLKEKLPADVQPFVGQAIATDQGSFALLDLYRWSPDEFNANPYPVERVFKNIAASFCSYAARPSDVQLIIRDKLKIFEGVSAANTLKSYDCQNL